MGDEESLQAKRCNILRIRNKGVNDERRPAMEVMEQ